MPMPASLQQQERLVERLSGHCAALVISPGEQRLEFLHPEVPSRAASSFTEQHLLMVVGTGVCKKGGGLRTAR